MALKRELGLFSTTLYGVGVIIGAGIYSLIGVGAGISGNMLWLSFLISAAIAVSTGLSYAELSSICPKEAAEYNYTKKAFNKETFSFVVGWVLALGTVIAASTVAFGFGGYFSSIFGLDQKVSAVLLIGFMGILNYIGIKESAFFNNFASILEVLGLLIVIAAVYLLSSPSGTVDLFEMPAGGFASIIAGVLVVFFAYTGFENLPNLSEEVKDSRNIVPKALILSLAISTILYMVVAIAAVSKVGWAALSQSSAPLALVVSDGLGPYAHLLSIIALFSTANTALVFLIASSRVLYGMSSGGSLPGPFSKTGDRGTPFYSVAFTTVIAAVFISFTDIKMVAQLADLGVFIAYVAVNGALIALANSKDKRTFTTPRFAGIPVFAWFGMLSSLFMLAHFGLQMWALEALIIAGGMALFYFNGKKRSEKAKRGRM